MTSSSTLSKVEKLPQIHAQPCSLDLEGCNTDIMYENLPDETEKHGGAADPNCSLSLYLLRPSTAPPSPQRSFDSHASERKNGTEEGVEKLRFIFSHSPMKGNTKLVQTEKL